jgi:gamma-glutamylaminecyclotransferase
MATVFVYGTLKYGFGNHHILHSSRSLGHAITIEHFHMRCVGFPHIVADANGGPVLGELYDVDDNTLQRLDRLEGNGSMYVRRKVLVRLANGRFASALVYEARSLVGQGSVVQPIKGSNVLEWHGREWREWQ